MKLLQGIMISFLLGMTLPAHAINQDAQADLLLAKISTALKNDRTSEALSACTKLEKLGSSLEKPLPESFYYYYIETLHRIGAKENVLKRAYAYLDRYDKDDPHYGQVTAIVRELQLAAMRAGKVDADAAVTDWKETDRLQKEKEHEQTLGVLLACQREANALEGTEKEMNVAFAEINAQSDALLTRKAALDQRAAMIDHSGQGTPEEQKEMRVAFNRDSLAYNDAVYDFNIARESYAAKVEGQSRRFQGYKDRCADLTIIKSDLEEFCGMSADWFCRGNE